MRDTGRGKRKVVRDWRVNLVIVALVVTPITAVLTAVPATRDVDGASLVSAGVAGVALLIATILSYLHWHVRPVLEAGWTLAATVVISVQVIAGAGFSLAVDAAPAQTPWFTTADAVASVVAVSLVACRKVERVVDPLLLGLGIGLTLVGLRGLVMVLPELDALPLAMPGAALLVVPVAYLGVARGVLADRSQPVWAARHLSVAVCLVGLGTVAHSVRWSAQIAALTAGVAFALAAVLWTSATYVLVREAIEAQGRRSAELEESLHHMEAESRSAQEQLHEAKSTIAGIVNATRLLGQPVKSETRRRLERTVRAELERLERLLAGDEGSEPGPVDLDETLDVLLESHRARGRTIEWQPCGASVHGDRDDVAEVLNILLDNAAKHSGGVPSHVDVTHDSDGVRIAVCDEGPGVPREMREHIFDWGARASTEPGHGIGLHVARRLVTRHGGSLTLADQDTRGSAFVVRLPAARTSEENHGRHA